MTLRTIPTLAPRRHRRAPNGWLSLGPERHSGALSPIVLTAALVSLASLVPLGFVLVVAVQTGWPTVVAMVWRPRVGELLVDTVLLVAATVPLTAVLALAMAWLVERSDVPWRGTWGWLAVAPLAVPAFVQSYAWISLVPGLHGLPGGVLVSVLAYFPFLYLPVAAQLRQLDPAIEDAAAALGFAPWAVFRRVVLPQLRLALSAGGLLVGLHLLAEYGLFVMIRFDTFTTAIVDQFQSSYNGPAANMLSGVLVACCGLLLLVQNFARGSERTARVGSGAPPSIVRARLGRATWLGLALPLVTAGLSLGVPLVTLGYWLAVGTEGWLSPRFGLAIGQTLVLALGGGLVTTALALPMAWLSVRAPGRAQRVLEACQYYVGSLPGVVVALAVVTITVRVALPLYQTVAALLFAYALMFLPRALVGLRASIAQVPVELERAAMALGRPQWLAIAQVTLRLAAPGAAASVALCALGIGNELTATLMLSPNGTRTLATEFWALTSEIDYAAAAPYAVMMIVLSLPMTVLLHAQSKRIAGR